MSKHHDDCCGEKAPVKAKEADDCCGDKTAKVEEQQPPAKEACTDSCCATA